MPTFVFQVFSRFDVSSLDNKFEQFVSDPEDLKRILQYQQKREKLTKCEFTLMSDFILATLASKQTLVASEDDIDQKMNGGAVEGIEKSEEKTVKQEDSCSVEDICEDDEETGDSSTETNPNSRPHEYALSAVGCQLSAVSCRLSTSQCYEEAGAAGDNTGKAAYQPRRCSQSSVEGAKEHLDLSKSKEPSKESILSLPVSETLKRANENTSLRCSKTFASRSSLKKQHFVHSSIRPFKCTQLDKSCESQKDLNQHFLIHSKPKVPSFACRLCEKRFNFQALLTVHHGGERPGCTATRGS
uniref:PR domain zinc finger protein 1-like n=1 Tax=Scatophagus argus TaxID=75038 RepID=UPI001ED82355|nr:PR domain zinc finger protein 1-like [Scatophagus argus]